MKVTFYKAPNGHKEILNITKINKEDEEFFTANGVTISMEELGGDEMDEQTPPHTCKYCGAPSWLDESDQSLPPDYCHESDHGLPDNDGW